MNVKLGKKPARRDAVRLKLARYLTAAALPRVPADFGHDLTIGPHNWGMLANDRYGDCVWAGAAHETMLLAREAGRRVAFTAAGVLADYAAVTGFDPARPASDQGTDVQQAAAYRRKTGIVDAAGQRHRIGAYLALTPGNIAHLYLATYLFGAVGIGLNLPTSALAQSQNGQAWDVVAGSPVEGGHYVPLVGRRGGQLHVISWGSLQIMSEDFLKAYCDEAIAYVSQECLTNQKSPEGFAYANLIDDLEQLA